MDLFAKCTPNVSDTFQKPKNAGLKGVSKKRRNEKEEPVLFINQFENDDADLLFDSIPTPT